MRWIMTGHNITVLNNSNSALAERFFGSPKSFRVENDAGRIPMVASALGATPVLRYTSYSRFVDDLSRGTITPAYHWVMYDPENWDSTPLEERKHPLTYLQMFGQRAHAAGFRNLMQPARNLALSSEEFKRASTESLDSWYLRAGVPMISARYAEGLLVQSQVHQTEANDWEHLLSGAKDQVSDANPFAFVCGGLSTARGNAYDMFNSATTLPVDGYYVTMGDNSVEMAVTFFDLMEKAGY